MSEPSNAHPEGAPRPKFPKFTKKNLATVADSDRRAEVTPMSEASMSPLTPLPVSREPGFRGTSPTNQRAEIAGPDRVLPVLRRTHFGKPPAVCAPWEGKVASYGPLSGFVITSPTQEHVPQLPKDVDIIHTFVDGRWGVREYARHPQWYVQEMTHIACIPRNPSPPSVPAILFETLRADEHWEEDPSVAVHGLGRIRGSVRVELRRAAETVIDGTTTLEGSDEKALRYRSFLVMLLRQVLTRMNYLPAVASRALAIAAHVQRLTLELAGLKTYLAVIVPRMHSSQDFSQSVLDVVGGFLREGAVTQTWHRVGIPYWVLQPLTQNVTVYKVVSEDALPHEFATARCDPPILHRAGAFVGVSNLTGNWISSMVLSISKHIAGSHLSALNLVALPDVPASDDSSGKRARIEERDIASGHLSMRPAGDNVGKSKAARRRKRRQAGEGPPQETASASQQAPGHDTGTEATRFEHPSRAFILSPFVNVSELWAEALRENAPVPQNPNSALYFFPPPFLLDTVASTTDCPPACPYPERARGDAKVNRYLHNLLRIREFCRLRLFDVSLENRPLSIGEWRAALWGEYLPQTSVRAGGEGSEARRAKRRLGERNGVGALFHKVAHMDTYSADAIVNYEGRDVDLRSFSTDVAIRQNLLWESHEVNFRAELVALDTLLVHKKDWQEINRWEREMLISGVWGPPTSGATVVADTARAARVFCWTSPPDGHWESCRERLRHFLLVLTRWPSCPENIIQAAKRDLAESEFAEAQRLAVRFYVRTFVCQFARLPIPPIVSI